jgi:hypothetical protein
MVVGSASCSCRAWRFVTTQGHCTEVLQTEGFLMRDIVTGAVLIGIGLVMGGSVFLGDFSLLNIFFDGLGTFFIIKGVVPFIKNRQAA